MNEETEAKLIKIAENAVRDAMAACAEPAEKPKIRHGDYGITNYPEPRINFPLLAMKANMPDKLLKVAHSDGSGRVGVDEDINWLGNIFDDLEALAKPIEEFTYKGYSNGAKICLEPDGDIDLGSLRRIMKKDIHDFIRNLRRMEAFQQ